MENGELKLHRLVVGHRYSLTYHILHILKIVFHGQYSTSAIYQNLARCHVLKCVIIGSATLNGKRKKERGSLFVLASRRYLENSHSSFKSKQKLHCYR